MTTIEIYQGMARRSAWLRAVKALFYRYRDYRDRRRAVLELSSVDPRTLKDMGFDPSEIGSIVHGDARDRRVSR